MKKYFFSVVLIMLSIGCFIAYNLIGSEVLPDGTLSEPFFLIPIGFLFAIIAVTLALIIYIKSKDFKS
jgi:hypothetical protein